VVVVVAAMRAAATRANYRGGLSIALPFDGEEHSAEFWVKRGVALLCRVRRVEWRSDPGVEKRWVQDHS